MNNQEMAARINVIEGLIQSALSKLPEPQRHDLFTEPSFRFGSEPGETLIIQHLIAETSPTMPDRSERIHELRQKIETFFAGKPKAPAGPTSSSPASGTSWMG
jgi:hypothetical protein